MQPTRSTALRVRLMRHVLHESSCSGVYRFGEDGREGEITVMLRGNRLYESWGTDKPVELVPGKFDSFFSPGFPILRLFRKGLENCSSPCLNQRLQVSAVV